jgi:hypothetical protein
MIELGLQPGMALEKPKNLLSGIAGTLKTFIIFPDNLARENSGVLPQP